MSEGSRKGFLVSARKYRPLRFDDVHGQEHVTRTLSNAVRRARVAHAYLLCGPRGVGKTTVARILARAFNCERDPDTSPCNECDSCQAILRGRCVDVMEIDAASNTGVDNVRDLRENAQLPPAQVRCKVYIIDEVHRLSGPAFDALLKILEEPPAHVRFVFATTEVHKVPSTILSRCQRFTFHRVSTPVIVQHLNHILSEQPDINVPEGLREEMLYAIARSSEGAMRDALSLFDQVLSFCGDAVTMDDVRTVLGLVSFSVLSELVDSLIAGRTGEVIRQVHAIVESGRDPGQLAQDIIAYYRDLMVARVTGGNCADIVEHPPEDLKRLVEQSAQVAPEGALRAVEVLWEASRRMSFDPDPLLVLEVAAAKIALVGRSVAIDDLIAGINRLQDAGPPDASRAPAVAPASPAPVSPAPAPAPAAPAPPPPRPQGRDDSAGLLPAAAPAADTPDQPAQAESKPIPSRSPALFAKADPPPPWVDDTADDVSTLAPPAAAQPAVAAQPTPDQPPAAPPPGELKLEDAVRLWPRVREEFGREDRTIGTYLDDAQPIAMNGETIIVGFPEACAFHVTRLDKPVHTSRLASLFYAHLGRRVQVQLQTTDQLTATPHPDDDFQGLEDLEGLEAPPPTRGDAPVYEGSPFIPVAAADPETIQTEVPLVARILQLFEGQITHVRPAT